MKLPIKKKYLDDILVGKKKLEYRDAHITFVSEETGKEYRFEVCAAKVAAGIKDKYPDVLEDENTLVFLLE